MARRCAVTGKGVQAGNNVSHSVRRTRRRFLPNIQPTSVYSETLQESFKVRLSMHGLRTIDHRGGLDAFLMKAKPAELSEELRRIRRRVEGAQRARDEAAASGA
jgi:large subunit ribosomal protein L28